ncbi:MAG: pantoate--beta-alanine ligase [Ekhidna sp.]|nr:pantoate--beta-alanine ligase [Ekhidna sp.]
MRTLSTPVELSKTLEKSFSRRLSIGFVPTMGALHQGHSALISKSKNENDVTVVSIFVNPAQFNNSEDLNNYPRPLEKDLNQLDSLNVDYVFTPDEEELYPQKQTISIDFGNMAKVLEGQFRPGHFNGVGIIVSKLLHIVSPTRAYFGLKDLQQFLLIRRMCEELHFQVEIVGVETVREKSGLAVSSRNQRLSQDGKEVAKNIYKGLKKIEEGIHSGSPLDYLLEKSKNFYRKLNGLEVEYLEVITPSNMNSVTSYQNLKELAVCFAGYVEGIRLIDNLCLQLK